MSKLKELAIHRENPFVDLVSGERRKRREVIYEGGRVLVDPATGEVEDEQIAIARIKWVDPEQFIKVYLSNIQMLFDFDRPAQRVAEFVMFQVGHRSMGKGEVFLPFYEFQEYMRDRVGGSRMTFLRGVEELARKGVIARSPVPNLWWINPALMFNGDRARFVTEYRRRKPGSQERLEAAGQTRLALEPGPSTDAEGDL
jgi:hypothetical protein